MKIVRWFPCFTAVGVVIRWDKKAGLRRDAIRSQVIDALEAQEINRPAMKKTSTAAADKIGKSEGRRLTVGLDLGDRSSWCCVLDETGEVLLEQKLATTPKAMKEVFGGMPRSRIAFERWWRWLGSWPYCFIDCG